MTSKRERAIVVSALKHAAPYIRLFKRKVFVIKAGGEIFADAGQTSAFVEQVGILHQVGIKVVLIHGGGPQSTRLAAALGLEGTARGVFIIDCAMPVAVVNYLFATRYGRSPSEVASLVVLSTTLTFVTLPLLLAWLL